MISVADYYKTSVWLESTLVGLHVSVISKTLEKKFAVFVNISCRCLESMFAWKVAVMSE